MSCFSDKARHLKPVFAKVVEECRQGVAWNYERLTSVRQKPSNE
jgi:hypothetical protein